MNPDTADRCLRLLLRIIGGVELLAIPFIILPLPWMAFIHERLLLQGPLPEGRVVEYMARVLSTIYAVHGAMVMYLSFDVRRYRPVILFLSALHILLGICVVGIDMAVGWPWYWVVMEGPSIGVGGALCLLFARAGARGDT